MDKTDRIVTAGKMYEVAGTWSGMVEYIVFSPVDPSEKECLLYTRDDVSELLETGAFLRVEG